jgi:hypothetical protein
MKRTMLSIVIPILIALAAPAAIAQTSAPLGQTAKEAAKATAIIRGRITASDTGRGLRRAQVSIGGGDLPQRRSASTNSRGDFEIRDLPPGRYTLTVTRSGYLSFEYGQRRIGERGKTIELSEGEALSSIDVRMPRASVISGRVLDENAEPVPNASIWIMRQEFFRGRRRFVPVSVGVRTDDIGQYRATGLAPGEYLLFATVPETWTAGAEKKRVFGYAPTYFPGTTSIEQAQQVKVAAGKETPNVDVALIAAPAAVISGTARGSDGTPLSGGSVSLSQVMMGPGGMSFGGVADARIDADGNWMLRDVPPGEYEIEATAADRNRSRESAWAKLTVQGADLDGVSLISEAPVKLAGEVVTDSGAALPQPTVGHLRVTIDTTGDRRQLPVLMNDDNGQVKSDGAFTASALAGASVIRVVPLPRGWAIKSIEVGGREAPDGAIELKGGRDETLRIVLTNGYPAITGRVTDERAADAEGTVVLFPADESRWTTGGAPIRSGRTDQRGIFRIEAIPPGDYFVAALEAVQTWQVYDPEFLEALKARAERITLREGASAPLTLRIQK